MKKPKVKEDVCKKCNKPYEAYYLFLDFTSKPLKLFYRCPWCGTEEEIPYD